MGHVIKVCRRRDAEDSRQELSTLEGTESRRVAHVNYLLYRVGVFRQFFQLLDAISPHGEESIIPLLDSTCLSDFRKILTEVRSVEDLNSTW